MKRLLLTLSQKWPEYLLEILVLIIGIYGAFALEEWNEQRKETSAKSALIENLSEEFRNNLTQIDIVLSNDRLAVAVSLKLMELIKTKDWSQLSDSSFSGVGRLYSFDPSIGVLRSAISSGEIQLLSNKRLISHLFSWEDLVKDAKENEIRFIDHHIQTMPQFLDRIQIANTLNIYDSKIPKSNYQSNYTAVLNDPHYENFLAYKIIYINEAEKELIIVRERIIEILELLEKE